MTNQNNSVTINTVVSRLREIYKVDNEDAFVSDRFLYSLFTKYGDLLIRRKDKEGKLKQNDALFQILPVVPLMEVSKIEAGCTSLRTNCVIRRTVEPLPEFITNDNGPIIRNIFSLDTSEEVTVVSLQKWLNIAQSTYFKYNKTKYAFFRNNGHLYFPNVNWGNVHLEALFNEEVSGYCIEDETGCTTCGGESYSQRKLCKPIQETHVPYPKDLIAEIESMIRQDMLTKTQLQSDTSDNSQNQMR